jgi:hypothetical protein
LLTSYYKFIGTQITESERLGKFVLPSLSFISYLPFDLAVLLPPPLFDFEDAELFALFDDEAEDFAGFALPDCEPPALFAFDEEVFLPPLSPPTKSPTASATTFIAERAAPVAAPERISPAASLTASRTGEAVFFADFFAVEEDFDFEEAEALFAVDFVGVVLFVVDF